MSELSDLELCKRIAEIEGYKTEIFKGKLEVTKEFLSGTEMTCDYKPLTNKALLFDLTAKYCIVFDRHPQCPSVGFAQCPMVKDNKVNMRASSVKFMATEQLPRAILTAIVEANNE